MSRIPSDPSWLAPPEVLSAPSKPRVSTGPGNDDFARLIDVDTALAPPAAFSRSRVEAGAPRSDTAASRRSDPGVTRANAAARDDAKPVEYAGKSNMNNNDNETAPKPADRAADASADLTRAKRDDPDRITKSDAADAGEDEGTAPPAVASTGPVDPAQAAAIAVQPAILPDPAPVEETSVETRGTAIAVALLTGATQGGATPGGAAGEPGGTGLIATVDQQAKVAGLAAALGKNAQADAAEPGEEDAPAAEGDPAPAGAAAGKAAVATDEIPAIGLTKDAKNMSLARLASPKLAPASEDQSMPVQAGPAAPLGPQADPTTGAPHKTGSAHMAGQADEKDADGNSPVDAPSDQPRASTIPASVEPGAALAAARGSEGGAVPAIGGITSGTKSAAPTASVQARTETMTSAVPVAMLGVEIAAHAQAGKRSFDIRLDPPELGRVQVRLDVDRDGNVTSRLLVDRAETLDLLRRDAPQLERALQDAGLKTGSQTMQFMLRDQQAGQQGMRDETLASAQQAVVVEAGARSDDAAVTYSRMINRLGGLDIRV